MIFDPTIDRRLYAIKIAMRALSENQAQSFTDIDEWIAARVGANIEL